MRAKRHNNRPLGHFLIQVYLVTFLTGSIVYMKTEGDRKTMAVVEAEALRIDEYRDRHLKELQEQDRYCQEQAELGLWPRKEVSNEN